jgi:hypothetical protein
MIKPILIESTHDNWPTILQYHICFPGQEKLGYYDNPIKTPTHPFDIILIDTEAKIVKSPCLAINKNLDTIYELRDLFIEQYNPNDDWIKIITSTNASHNLPQLSPQSIQLIINYYNKYKCMPESVEVEKESNWYVHTPSGKYWDDEPTKMKKYPNKGDFTGKFKLNQQGEVDVIIPEVEEKEEAKHQKLQMPKIHKDDLPSEESTELITSVEKDFNIQIIHDDKFDKQIQPKIVAAKTGFNPPILYNEESTEFIKMCNDFVDKYLNASSKKKHKITYSEQEVRKLFNEFAKNLSYMSYMGKLKTQSDYIKYSIEYFKTNKKK